MAKKRITRIQELYQKGLNAIGNQAHICLVVKDLKIDKTEVTFSNHFNAQNYCGLNVNRRMVLYPKLRGIEPNIDYIDAQDGTTLLFIKGSPIFNLTGVDGSMMHTTGSTVTCLMQGTVMQVNPKIPQHREDISNDPRF
jgi:hypothetical protein